MQKTRKLNFTDLFLPLYNMWVLKSIHCKYSHTVIDLMSFFCIWVALCTVELVLVYMRDWVEWVKNGEDSKISCPLLDFIFLHICHTCCPNLPSPMWKSNFNQLQSSISDGRHIRAFSVLILFLSHSKVDLLGCFGSLSWGITQVYLSLRS